jgi:1-acyl-sn-glycerol-3-phosphate acyltransferase
MTTRHSRPFLFLCALRSFAAFFVIILSVLLAGPPLLVWTVVSRRPAALYRISAFVIRVALVTVGVTVTVAGVEHLRPGTATVYAVNHTSNIEPPIIFAAFRRLFPRLRVLYKAELRSLPLLVWAFDLVGFVPIERSNREQSLPAVDRAVQALVAGNSFLIFPEGTRSRTGELLPFKKGGFVMAIKAQVPVVPVAISGARDAMERGSFTIRPARILVELSAAVPTEGLGFDDRDALIARVRASIEARLAAASQSAETTARDRRPS